MTPTPVRRNAAVVAVAAGLGLLVVGAFFGPSPVDGSAGHDRHRTSTSTTSTTSTTRPTVTTTTGPAVTTTSTTIPRPAPTVRAGTAPTPPAPTAPASGGSPESLGVDPPPTKPPPAGVEVASEPATCSWSPADGGTLRASGTVTNTGNANDTWLVSVDWNDDVGFLDNENGFFVAAPGQSTPWSLSVTGADAPSGTLTCAVEVA